MCVGGVHQFFSEKHFLFFLYLFDFLSFHMLVMNFFFITDIFVTEQAIVIIFGVQVDENLLYR